MASTSEEERQSKTRNYCNSCGYESVALVPIKAINERIGLIQLNDKRTGMYDESLIGYLEMISEQIGLAVQSSFTYTKLKERTDELQKTINLMAGRELRMVELKETIEKLRAQLESAGLTPVADDPLLEKRDL